MIPLSPRQSLYASLVEADDGGLFLLWSRRGFD
jgi:hypothetical protein